MGREQKPTSVPMGSPSRGRGYAFVAHAEATGLESEILIQGRTIDLSLYGCGIVAEKPFAAGTRVRVRITHAGAKFEAIGRVAHTSDTHMGIVFVRIESNDQTTLEKWVNKLREVKA